MRRQRQHSGSEYSSKTCSLQMAAPVLCVISVILRRVYFRHKEKQQILFIKREGQIQRLSTRFCLLSALLAFRQLSVQTLNLPAVQPLKEVHTMTILVLFAGLFALKAAAIYFEKDALSRKSQAFSVFTPDDVGFSGAF